MDLACKVNFSVTKRKSLKISSNRFSPGSNKPYNEASCDAFDSIDGVTTVPFH